MGIIISGEECVKLRASYETTNLHPHVTLNPTLSYGQVFWRQGKHNIPVKLPDPFL